MMTSRNSSDKLLMFQTDTSCQALSLRDLAYQVVRMGDKASLAEIHERTVFSQNGSGPLTLAAYVRCLREKENGTDPLIRDRAYDLVIDKFCRLNGSATATPEAGREITDSKGDCRKYFAAFVRYVDQEIPPSQSMSALVREGAEARALQTHVRRHFNLSIWECRRSSFMTRYVWRLPGGSLSLLMPRTIRGRRRREWLEAHISSVDPTRNGERARVQAVIDEQIGQTRSFSLDEGRLNDIDSCFVTVPPVPGQDLMAISPEGLAATVAKEKADAVGDQRQAVRALGPPRLHALVTEVFSAIVDGNYHLSSVAAKYGLSKATLSRFAGMNWGERNGASGGSIPDLWRNTAKVLGSNPEFVEAAQSAGVWGRVDSICRGEEETHREDNS